MTLKQKKASWARRLEKIKRIKDPDKRVKAYAKLISEKVQSLKHQETR